MAKMESLSLALLLSLTLLLGILASLLRRFASESWWSSSRGVVWSFSGAIDSSSTAFSGLDDASRCALSNDVRGMRPYSGSVLPNPSASSSPRCAASWSWSADKIKDGRCGVTSRNPAARVQDLAKFSMLLTPPTWARELSRRAIEDLKEFC
jgi:hypothetical protein